MDPKNYYRQRLVKKGLSGRIFSKIGWKNGEDYEIKLFRTHMPNPSKCFIWMMCSTKNFILEPHTMTNYYTQPERKCQEEFHEIFNGKCSSIVSLKFSSHKGQKP